MSESDYNRVECSYDELVPVKSDKLKPNPKNPNIHTHSQLKHLASLINDKGQRSSIVISRRSGLMVKGHGTLMAIRDVLEWDKVAVEFQDFKSEKDEFEHMVADNEIARQSMTDMDSMMDSLKNYEDLDPENLGIPDFEIPDFSKPENKMPPEIEEEPIEAPKDPTTKVGDVWIFGEHMLLCGDATDPKSYKTLMGDDKADICFTSPPYNAGSLEIEGNESTQKKYASHDDELTEDDYRKFLVDNMRCVKSKAHEVFYNIGLVENNKRVIIELMSRFKDAFKDVIYWNKSTAAPHIEPGIVNNKVEFILCFGDGRRKFRTPQFGQGKYWNVIEGSNASGNQYAKIHKATFPLYLPENIVTNFCEPNGKVLDPFAGTGTTLIACEKSSRIFFGMELDPSYCDLIVKRWEEYTGKKAILGDTGKTFNEVSSDRGKQ